MRHTFALPSEHGAWVFLLSPLLIGLFAAQQFSPASFFLIITALAAFLIRQPVTITVKAYSGRRPRTDLIPARIWLIVYGLVALIGLTGMLLYGHINLLFLGVPGLIVFAWHLYLVSRRQERRQAGVEILGSGVLALSAPAAYWVGRGDSAPLGWLLFLLTWLQSAASIVYAYLRLQQREMKAQPALRTRWQMARRALLYTSFNLATGIGLSIAQITPPLLAIPYALQWLETLYGTLRPAVGVKPTRIGLRQLVVSSLFTLLFIVFWR